MITCGIFLICATNVLKLGIHLLWGIRNRWMKFRCCHGDQTGSKTIWLKTKQLFYSQRLFCKNNFFHKTLLHYFSELVCFNQDSDSKFGNNSIFWFLLFSVYCYYGDRYFNFFQLIWKIVLWYIFAESLTLNRPGGAESAHRLVLSSAVLKR